MILEQRDSADKNIYFLILKTATVVWEYGGKCSSNLTLPLLDSAVSDVPKLQV